jgi:hypothetical protein
MSNDREIDLLKRVFAPWRQTPAGNAFPAPASLARALDGAFPLRKGEKKRDVYVDIGVAKFFATAAIDIWHRAVHSLLISVLLTDESPIWSSVSGYYSSHYTMRGLAHLLGYYQLFQRKCTIQLSYDSGKYVCTYSRGYNREHDWYWDVVKKNPILKADPFFATSASSPNLSDTAHRDRSNYWDHLPYFPPLQNVDRNQIRTRVHGMSKMELQTPPELREDRFPDAISVQLIAYQRIARFRRLLDETLTNNRLWDVHRNPPWAANYIDYQLVESRGAVQR